MIEILSMITPSLKVPIPNSTIGGKGALSVCPMAFGLYTLPSKTRTKSPFTIGPCVIRTESVRAAGLQATWERYQSPTASPLTGVPDTGVGCPVYGTAPPPSGRSPRWSPP